jgi:transitional endoplasmic reticulum ATPase
MAKLVVAETPVLENAALADVMLELAERLSGKKQPNWSKIDVPVDWPDGGRRIQLPADPARMPLTVARETLDRIIKDEDQDFKVFEWIDAFPHDAAVAFTKACRNLYGLSSPVSTWYSDPQMLTIKTGYRPGEFVQVAMGNFKLPGVEKQITTGFSFNNKGHPGMVIMGTVAKKDREIILRIAEETRRIVREESIYRGKAISIQVDDNGQLMLAEGPDFLNVEDTTEAAVLFDDVTTDQITVNLLVPLLKSEACRQRKIPLGRKVLLEGRFGTGKSLTARMVANVAQRHGEWTYILLDKVQGLTAALHLARRYMPCVVFAEDIDRITEERDEDANDLINTISGVVGKDDEVMVLLSTNHVDEIHQAMLRPGRLDAIISLKAPDAPTVERLLRFYARDLIPQDLPLPKAGEALAGQIPSSIRECVSRATLSMVGRDADQLSDHDLFISAESMGFQLGLLNRNLGDKSDAEKFVESFQAILHNGNGADGFKNPDAVERLVNDTAGRTRHIQSNAGFIQAAVGRDDVPDALVPSVNTKVNRLVEVLVEVNKRLGRIEGRFN